MKTYVSETSLRIVGKSWQVRHRLRSMLDPNRPNLTVAEYLMKRTKATGRVQKLDRS
ncbi:Z-ring formation inhibitor MciZ [Paenibacillus sp. N1-5-1-14]|uniref:Z-ring formation inhibitor MciZ n=1 Tax=Paenibacillus radicibacter TaxID=2972488 RepID=UPI002158F1BD|nr:Z-ring formation inhibitor MciZ [Paenibacillus radicibacter]MCR8642382.1 Z-ring formation inhibitor MciZ [Paenibacillus radicibacter]